MSDLRVLKPADVEKLCDVGRRAVQQLLDRGHAAGLIPRRIEAEFVEV